MSRRNFILVAGFLFFVVFFSAQAQVSTKANPYFTASEMPDMLKWYLAPPKPDSDEFARDIRRYYWGKEQRLNPERAAIAVRDSYYGLGTIVNEFSYPFGLQISRQNTKEIYTLLRDALATTDSICKIPKEYYKRQRPFKYFGERTLTPNAEASLSLNFSYPSGHTILGWSAALLLSEINPEAADTLLARGMMFGESRVIVGAHWQSDIEAGFHAASVAYAKLHTSDRFLHQMESAKKEFSRLKGKYPPLQPEDRQNDSTYITYKREKANRELLERKYNFQILSYSYGFDEETGLKMLFVKVPESPYSVANGVSNVVLTNDKNEIVYVVDALLRHDKDLTDEGSFYGIYVVGKDDEGEIGISDIDNFCLRKLIFQIGSSEYLNCTDIKFSVAGVPELIPFTPITEYKRKKYQRFLK